MCDAVKVIQLPHYYGLDTESILEWASKHDNGKVMEALPEIKKEIMKLPRAYIANIVYSIAGKPFQDWTNARIVERNRKVAEDKDLSINMDPSIAAIFRASNAVSGKCRRI